MDIDQVDGGWNFNGLVDDEAGLMMVVAWIDDGGWVLIGLMVAGFRIFY